MKYASDCFEKAVTNNVSRRPGAIKDYRRAINQLSAFQSLQKKANILLEELNFEFAPSFKNYPINASHTLGTKGMTEVSAATVIKKFRTIFSQAVEKGVLKKNPFELSKIKAKSPRKGRLTINLVNNILKVNPVNFNGLELYRDVFLFSIFTGGEHSYINSFIKSDSTCYEFDYHLT